MSQFPMQLNNACEVCGQRPLMLVAPMAGDAKGTYMCGTCKAVYYPSGKRNPAYPSIYDGPKPAFDAAHSQAVAGDDTIPRMDSPAQHLLLAGLQFDAVVMVCVDGGWEYGNAKDYDDFSKRLLVAVPHRAQCWYPRWRSAEQPLPLENPAPPSPRQLAAVVKRQTARSKAFAVPYGTDVPSSPKVERVETVRVYTLVEDTNGNCAVLYTALPKPALRVQHLEVGFNGDSGVTVYVYADKPRGRYLVFESESGALLGVSTMSGSAILKAKNVFKDMRQDEIVRVIAKASLQARDGVMIGPDQFLAMEFV